MTKAIATKVTPRELIERSIADNTRRSYTGAMNLLQAWLEAHRSPLNDASLAAYLTHLFNEGKAPATAGLVVAAVRFSARMAGRKDPVVGELTERALSAYKREMSHVGHGQAHGLKWEDADRIARVAFQDGDLTGFRDAAIIAVMSDALLRVSEVAALQREHVEFMSSGDGVLHIRRSKTDQEGKGATLFLGRPTVKYLKHWLSKARVTDGSFFRRVYKDVVHPCGLSTRTVMRVIKRRAHEAGIEENVSGHSLRVGSAQSLARAGATLVDMQVCGRWKSPDMPARYAQGEIASRGAVAKLRYCAGKSVSV